VTPDELRALADEATPGPWRHLRISQAECVDTELGMIFAANEAQARLVALAPDLARLCAEMGEALEILRNGYDDHERECASLWEEPSRSMPCDCAVGVIDAALAKLAELEAR
jgi:hypothetical protein